MCQSPGHGGGAAGLDAGGQCKSGYSWEALRPVSAPMSRGPFLSHTPALLQPGLGLSPTIPPPISPPFLPLSLCSGLLPSSSTSSAFGVQVKAYYLQKSSLIILSPFIYLLTHSFFP